MDYSITKVKRRKMINTDEQNGIKGLLVGSIRNFGDLLPGLAVGEALVIGDFLTFAK